MALYFLFDDMRYNLLLYFSILTIILELFGHEKIMPSLKKINAAPVVQTPAGDIGGILMSTKYGRNIHAYKGIPYAKPPLGDLRFKKTKSLEENAWEGVFDGRFKSGQCVQPSGVSIYPVVGNEDCLHLNVYFPEIEQSDVAEKGLLPVMVWFHGGGFTSGESNEDLWGPGYLLDKDVILVTVNYRLGIFGFLDLGNEEAPGNQGLWDQLEALKWVQRNIGAFGGNRKKVTIFGESAGGWSVSSHLGSQKSKGHFSAAIVQSGPLDFVGLKADEKKPLAEIHQIFAQKMGCNEVGTVDCLREKSLEELMANMNMFDEYNTWPFDLMAYPVIWAPTDDHDKISDPFFSKHPRDIFKEGLFNTVPTMIGTTKDEGLLSSAQYHANPDLYHNLKTNWTDFAAKTFLGQYFQGEGPLSKELGDKVEAIAEFYFKNGIEFESQEGFKNLTDAFGDSGFLYGTHLMAEQLAKRTKTYYYHFDHLGSFSLADLMASGVIGIISQIIKKAFGFHSTKSLGVSHADDNFYLFKAEPFLPVTFAASEEDQKMVDSMVNLWTNFATHHDPTPINKSWPVYNPENHQKYVRLRNSEIILGTDQARDQRLTFWKNVFNDFS